MLAFPLTTYEETRPWSRAIEEEVLRRHMPPWRAVPGYGVFINDGGLTGRELQLMVAWIQGNGPKDSAQRVIINVDQRRSSDAERLRGDYERWDLGKPDIRRALPQALIAAGEQDHVRQVAVDLALPADTMIRALEFKPSDRRVLRAASFSIQETGQWIGNWTPWYSSLSLPPGTAHHISAGAHVVAELHYRGTSVPVNAGGQLGMSVAVKTPSGCTASRLLASDGPPQQTPGGWRASSRLALPEETQLLALNPQLTPSASSLEVTAHKPNGQHVPLLFVKDIMPEWPTPYILKDAVTLPPGTTISMTAYMRESAPGTSDKASPPVVRLMLSGRNCASPAGTTTAPSQQQPPS